MSQLRLRPLIAAPSSSGVSSSDPGGRGNGPPDPNSSSLASKASKTPSACLACRKSRSKCSGERPRCFRCEKHDTSCKYDAEPNTTSAVALKRKHQEMVAEVGELRALVDFLRTQPDEEVQEVLQLLRNSAERHYVPSVVKQSSSMSLVSTVRSSEFGPTQLSHVDAAALARSTTRVPARPWTTVAGDGLVSELVSTFFAVEHPNIFAFIDRDCFVADMRSQTPESAKYCSTLLVNAICAFRCPHTCSFRRYSRLAHQDISAAFFDEATRLVVSEQNRVSLCNVQGLYIMYCCCNVKGEGVIAMSYKTMAFDMLRELKLEESTLKSLKGNVREAHGIPLKVASRALWGFYCYDSFNGFLYLRSSMVARPSLPRIFSDVRVRDSDNVLDADEILATALFESKCHLADILNDIMEYNSTAAEEQGGLGSSRDLEKRAAYYRSYLDWCHSLLPQLQLSHTFTSAIFLQGAYADQVLLALYRPLNPDVHLPEESCSAGKMCLLVCQRIINNLEKYERSWMSATYSGSVAHPVFNVAVTLLNLLEAKSVSQSTVHGSFGRICCLLDHLSSNIPICNPLRRALKAILQRKDIGIPSAALPYLAHLPGPPHPLQPEDVAAPRIPLDQLVEKSSQNSDEAEHYGPVSLNLQTLLEKWSALAID